MARAKTLIAAIAAMFIAAAGCTMKSQDPPPLTGPSEQGTSLQMIANPDVLTQDGGSQSAITVIARGPSGQPLSGLSIRADVTFNGAVTDAMGRLSARNIVTDANGRADVVYTAPLAKNAGETFVAIQFIPVGTDAANTLARSVNIRLLPQGSVGGGSDIQAVIDPSTQTTAEVGEEVLFDGTGSTSSTGIASFRWDFDDGHKAGDPVEVHSFSSAGVYNVELTVTDPYGNSDTDRITITVGPLSPPAASFTWLPAAPTAGNPVSFDGSASSAAAGHSIVRYTWDWGDGTSATTATDPVQTHTFAAPGTYVVKLTVTDDTGQTSSTIKSITVS